MKESKLFKNLVATFVVIGLGAPAIALASTSGRPLDYESAPAPTVVSRIVDSVTGEEPREPVPAKPLAIFVEEAATINETPVDGDPERGKALFQSATGCQVCHGQDARGNVGPDIRAATVPMVVNAMQNFNEMIGWRGLFPDLFAEQSLKDVVAYLHTLPRD